LKFPVAQTLTLIYRLVQITAGDRFQPVTFLDITCRDQLAGQQRIEQPNDTNAQVVFDELRVELGVVRDFDRAWGGEQLSQVRQRVTSPQIAFSKVIYIDYENSIRGRQLDQAQPREVRIEIGGFGIEPNNGLLGERFRC